MAGAARCGAGPAGQHCHHLPRITASKAAGKKKALHAVERDTERVQTWRTAFRETVQDRDVRRLQCVDESGVNVAMTRRCGQATPGQRVVDSVPDNYGTTQTLLAVMGLEGLEAPWVVDGAVTGAILHGWVREELCPTLQRGAIVLWDHLSAHKVTGVAEWLATRGARLIRLAPYAPDCNPIEQCWSKIKTFLRRAKARTVEALITAIKEALDTVTATDMRGWFAHCGYPVH
jgi:transposase